MIILDSLLWTLQLCSKKVVLCRRIESNPENCKHTVEPFGVVLGGPEWWHSSKAPVNDRVPAREVDDRGSVQFSILCHHCCRVMAGVIGTTCHSIHSLQYTAHIPRLTQRQQDRETDQCLLQREKFQKKT